MNQHETDDDTIVIVSSARTPMGGFQGDLSPVSAPELGAASIKAALERANLKGLPGRQHLVPVYRNQPVAPP